MPCMLSFFGIKEEQTGHRGKKKKQEAVSCYLHDCRESSGLEMTPLIY